MIGDSAGARPGESSICAWLFGPGVSETKFDQEKAMLKRSIVLISSCILVFFILSEIGHAAVRGRQGRGEIFLGGRYVAGDTTTGLGITTEVDDFPAFGFGLGYNFHENFNVNGEMLFSSTDFIGSSGAQRVKINSDVWIGNLNLDYYFLKTSLTPLLTGGIGFINFRGEHDSFEETDFSYNAGAGFRWEMTNQFFIKAIYSFIWTKLKDSDNTLMLHGPSLMIGFSF